MIGTDNPMSIDSHIAKGALRFAKEHLGVDPRIEVHRAQGRQVTFEPKELDDRIVRRYYPPPIGGGDGRLGQLVGSVGASDVVVGIGGSEGTVLILDLARSMNKPRVCVAAFGGAASEHFVAQQDFIRSHPHVMDAYPSLHEAWSDRSANRVIDIAEHLTSEHAYFISYAHEDAQTADLVELLLRREGRTVHRDDTFMHPGQALTDRVQGMIAQTTTFIALWSQNSADSHWCRREREYATALESGPITVFVLLDDTAVSTSERNRFALKGATREQITAAIATILAEESRRLSKLREHPAAADAADRPSAGH